MVNDTASGLKLCVTASVSAAQASACFGIRISSLLSLLPPFLTDEGHKLEPDHFLGFM